MRILTALIVLTFISGCGGLNRYLNKNLPNGGFDSMVVKSDYGPAFSIGMTATGATKDADGVLTIQDLQYDRTGNFTSAHITIKGLKVKLPEYETHDAIGLVNAAIKGLKK